MESWKRYLPEYVFVEWNEDSFDLDSHVYTKTAYSAGKYAFVSDFVRAYALHSDGGVYLDTDVEIKGSLNNFLPHRAFSGFEEPFSPFTAIWGAEKGHPWPARVLHSYTDAVFDINDLTPNTKSVSDILSSEFGIDRSRDALQQGREGVMIYPSTTFCLDLPFNVATHHFGGSWLTVERRGHWKYQLNRNWRIRDFSEYMKNDDLGEALKDLILRLGVARVLRAMFPIVLKSIFGKLRNLRKSPKQLR